MRSEHVIILFHHDDATRVTFEVVLKHEGWSVLGTSHADDALELIRDNHPALVVLDMSPPREGATRLLRTLHSEGSIVRVAALSDGEPAADYFELGATDVLHTPLAPTQLVNFVRQALGRS